MTDKINPILDAMSEIDDNIVTNTKKRRKHPLFIAAVTAAALAVIMGCAVIYEYNSGVKLDGKPAFDYNFTVKEEANVLTHEELLDMGASYNEENGRYTLHALPSEVFQKYNISPLMNENFSETESEIKVDYFTNKKEPIHRQIAIGYSLIDNTSGLTVQMRVRCRLVEETSFSSDYLEFGDAEYELVDLNDGSKALIYGNYSKLWDANDCHGTFSYDGMVYDFRIIGKDLENAKSFLARLGVM